MISNLIKTYFILSYSTNFLISIMFFIFSSHNILFISVFNEEVHFIFYFLNFIHKPIKIIIS